MLGLVVLGSRTWICTIAAPALAASRQELAICSGVTGTAGFLPGVSAEPVTAQEIITFRAIFSLLETHQPSGRELFAVPPWTVIIDMVCGLLCGVKDRAVKVIIVGGGIGGLTTALMLHARGIDCELFEQSE